MYRYPHAAPASQIPEERRGREVARFCHTCAFFYPLHRTRHAGKPLYGRDHIASPCAHEGQAFEVGADWWELAVEVLPAALGHPQDLTTNAPAQGSAPGAPVK